MILETNIPLYLHPEAQAQVKEEVEEKDHVIQVHLLQVDINTTKGGEDDNNQNHKLAIYITQSTNYTANISTVVPINKEVTVNTRQSTVKIVTSHHLSNKVLEVNNINLPREKEVANVSTIKLGRNSIIPKNKGLAFKTTHTFNTSKI